MDSFWNETSNDDLILPLPELTDLDGLEELLLDTASEGSLNSPAQEITSPLNLDSCGEYATSSDGSITPQLSPTSTDEIHFQFGINDEDDEERCINEKDVEKPKKTKRSKTKKGPTIRGKETKRKRNERERRRVKKISEAFNNLKSAVPFSVEDKKLSKLDTLRNALMYIENLNQMLKDDDLRREESTKIKTEPTPQTKQVNCHQPKTLISSPLLTSAIPLQFINGSWSYYQLVTFPVSGMSGDPCLAVPHFGGYSHVFNGCSALKA